MPENKIQRLQRAYRQVFLAPNGSIPEGVQKTVLADLAKFCYAAKPPTKISASGNVDALATMQVIGRQEVWQRMQAMMNLPIRDVTVIGTYGENDPITGD